MTGLAIPPDSGWGTENDGGEATLNDLFDDADTKLNDLFDDADTKLNEFLVENA